MTPPPVIDVVIVNWNTGSCLRDCLASVRGSAGVELGSVVVVDNDSRDGSVDDLPDDLPLTVVRNLRNVGFAVACNQGAELGTSELVLFLNPDTIVGSDTLAVAAAAMTGDRGICGASVVRPDGSPTIAASRFPTLANVVAGVLHLPGPRRHLPASELTSSREVDQVIGAFFLVRRSLFEKLGGFDERYFLYYEEVDLARRAREAGWSSYLVSDASLVHLENVSAKQSGGLALFHSLRSRTLYAREHWPRWQARALVAFTVLVELPLRLVRGPHRGEVRRAAADYLRFAAGGGR